MNNQEAFNRVYAHLKLQGMRSMSDDGTCAYAGDEGRSCAVGCLLPREICESLDELEADSSWNGVLNAADDGNEQAVEACEYLSGVDQGLLKLLQRAHDDGDDDNRGFWVSARDRLLRIAERFSLEVPEGK